MYFLHNFCITALQLSAPYLQTQQYFHCSKCRRDGMHYWWPANVNFRLGGKCWKILKKQMRNKETYYGSVRNALGVDWISYIDDIAKRIGVYPDFKKYLISDLPLFLKLVFGTALPCHYRLDGPHSWSGARNTIMESNMHSIRMMSKRWALLILMQIHLEF